MRVLTSIIALYLAGGIACWSIANNDVYSTQIDPIVLQELATENPDFYQAVQQFVTACHEVEELGRQASVSGRQLRAGKIQLRLALTPLIGVLNGLKFMVRSSGLACDLTCDVLKSMQSAQDNIIAQVATMGSRQHSSTVIENIRNVRHTIKRLCPLLDLIFNPCSQLRRDIDRIIHNCIICVLDDIIERLQEELEEQCNPCNTCGKPASQCGCQQAVACNSCYKPVSQCSCQAKPVCNTCYKPAAQCGCQAKPVCSSCYKPATQCSCYPKPACNTCHKPSQLCGCPTAYSTAYSSTCNYCGKSAAYCSCAKPACNSCYKPANSCSCGKHGSSSSSCSSSSSSSSCSSSSSSSSSSCSSSSSSSSSSCSSHDSHSSCSSSSHSSDSCNSSSSSSSSEFCQPCNPCQPCNTKPQQYYHKVNAPKAHQSERALSSEDESSELVEVSSSEGSEQRDVIASSPESDDCADAKPFVCLPVTPAQLAHACASADSSSGCSSSSSESSECSFADEPCSVENIPGDCEYECHDTPKEPCKSCESEKCCIILPCAELSEPLSEHECDSELTDDILAKECHMRVDSECQVQPTNPSDTDFVSDPLAKYCGQEIDFWCCPRSIIDEPSFCDTVTFCPDLDTCADTAASCCDTACSNSCDWWSSSEC